MTCRNVFPWVAAVLALMLCPAISAQDDPSQRLLPLPENGTPGMAQHMELLKKLRSLIESKQQEPPQQQKSSPENSRRQDAGSPAKSPPTIPPAQLQRFQDALKSLADKLPPGFVPPDLDTIPPEQLQKAMGNPAVQQQMKEMLQQFSKDGVLPPAGTNGSPLPRPPQENPAPAANGTNGTRKSDRLDGKGAGASQLPPPESLSSLRDFLDKLSEGASSPSPESLPGSSESKPPVISTPPRQPLRRRDRRKNSQSVAPDVNSTSPSTPKTPLENSPPASPTESAPIDSTANEKSPSSDRDEARTEAEMAPGLRRPLPPNPNLADRSQTRQNAMGTDSGDAEKGPDSRQKQLQNLQRAIEQMRELSEQSLPADSDAGRADASSSRPEPNRPPTPATEPQAGRPQSENANVSSRKNPLDISRSPISELPDPDAAKRMPEVSEFLKEQLKSFNFPPTPSDNTRSGGPAGSGTSRDLRANPSPLPSRETDSPGPEPSANSGAGQKSEPPMNIQKELAQKGFGETLKNIVERAKQESKQPKSSSDATPGQSPGTESGPQGTPELSESMIRVLDGLKDDLVEIAKDARFNDPPERSERSHLTPRQSDSGSSSTFNELRKAASEMLAAPSNPSRSNSGASGGGSAFSSRLDLTPVLVLAGILAAAGLGFWGMRYLKLRTAQSLAMQLAGPPIQPSEIQNRADVVRAFHEFSMRSTKKVQSWWTHRAVERVITASAPEKKAAVETLANAYEQARYLPQDHELSSEQIEAARSALRQCTAGMP